MTAAVARYRVAATACVAEPERTGSREVTFVPGDEDDRVTCPGPRTHNRTDRRTQEGIARRDQALHLGEIAGIGRRCGAPVHVMALVGADPGVVRYCIVCQVGSELAEVYNVGQTRQA